jgi:uncharacterized protein YukE
VPLFDWNLNVGNFFTIALALIGGIVAWVKIDERSQANRRAIDQLRDEFEDRANSFDNRYEKQQGEIAATLRRIEADMRTLHSENAQFREKVAEVHPTRKELGDLLQQIRDDIRELGRRMERRTSEA